MLTLRRPLILLAHIAAFALSLLMSFLVANRMEFTREWLAHQYAPLLLLFLTVKLVVFGLLGQYRGWWRYVGITDLKDIFRASLISALALIGLWTAALNLGGVRRALPEPIVNISQGVFVADLFGTILILAGVRMVIRLYHEEYSAMQAGRLKRFLIVGAGDAGEALLRDLQRTAVLEYDVVGFIDDDPAKQGTRIRGVPVLGGVERLPSLCRQHQIEEIAIAMPSATHRQRRRVVQVCEGAKVRFRTVPSLTDIASGRYRVSQIRDVDIKDLLSREAVHLDVESMRTLVQDRVILITGAGGSIGAEMGRQICTLSPRHLLLVEQAENPLFHIEQELRKDFPGIRLDAIIADITDRTRMDQVFQQARPQVVIHAAAHKHVPLMEANPGEAIKNNVLGTRIVADRADATGATHFVMISTDKAVHPTSVMGASKRVAEMYIQDLARTSQTDLVTVRFGNVLGSEGSVVPIFKGQIAAGGPVTVTDPQMQRYFMTIPEATQLTLQAAAMGRGGEIFVLDMGDPVRIVDLAKELITLSGFRPGEDIEIVFTGLRPGEKLFEQLRLEGEDMVRTPHPKILIWRNVPMDRDTLRRDIDDLIALAHTQDRDRILQKIKDLVPEYIQPSVGSPVPTGPSHRDGPASTG